MIDASKKYVPLAAMGFYRPDEAPDHVVVEQSIYEAVDGPMDYSQSDLKSHKTARYDKCAVGDPEEDAFVYVRGLELETESRIQPDGSIWRMPVN